MTAYQKCIDRLFNLQMFGIKLGLNSTRNLLDRLGRPDEKLEYIHLAGTNGKGSVGAMLASIFKAAGYRPGFYTSPHLVTFRERLVIGGQMITEDEVVELAAQVWDVADDREPPTFFEFVTVMAILHFVRHKADPIIWETGLGGRLDATNVVTPLISVITNISAEHQQYLGKTIKLIASEKAGIIKPGVPCVTAAQNRDAFQVIEDICKCQKSRLVRVGRDVRVRSTPDNRFNYYGLSHKFKDLSTALAGRHQRQNAATALAALELTKGYKWDEDHVRRGLSGVHWPGRIEVFQERPKVVLDGAHNPAAVKSLVKTLQEFDYNKLILVMGVMADKSVASVVSRITPLADRIIFTRPDYFRAADPADLKTRVKTKPGRVKIVNKVAEAVREATGGAGPDDLVLITGSLFVVGEARAFLTGEVTDGLN